jgi:hypothetical protein
MRAQLTVTILTAALALQACSSRPREFTPTLATAPADQGGFETAHAECRQLLAEGKLDSSGRLASGGAGAAAGATAMAVGTAAGVATGGYAGLAVASATVVALPFVAVASAWKVAKNRKNRKERAIQQATAGCLTDRGYPVVGWEPVSKKDGAR